MGRALTYADNDGKKYMTANIKLKQTKNNANSNFSYLSKLPSGLFSFKVSELASIETLFESLSIRVSVASPAVIVVGFKVSC